MAKKRSWSFELFSSLQWIGQQESRNGITCLQWFKCRSCGDRVESYKVLAPYETVSPQRHITRHKTH
ncbi:hypothetical protein J6590_107444, partial [Homalodisca vitripennis]